MYEEVIEYTTPLNRQVWRFLLMVDNNSTLRLTYYAAEHKDNTRQRNWRKDGWWDRYQTRDSTIKDPPLPLQVVAQVKTVYAQKILDMEVTRWPC